MVEVYLYSWLRHELKEGTRIKATWNQHSQRTAANGGDKAAWQQRPANMASVCSAAHIQPVTSTVDTNVTLKTLEQKFPECKDGDQFHSFYNCKDDGSNYEDGYSSSSHLWWETQLPIMHMKQSILH